MKTHDNLFEKTCSFESLLRGYYKAKRGKGMREAVARFGWRLEPQLLQLQKELTEGTYVPGVYKEFVVHDAKKRRIKAAPFRDRVVHQAVFATLEPIFDRGFIFDSYACRRGKGTLAAIARFEQFTKHDEYVLTGDISRYFASVDHTILYALLAKRISDQKILALCWIIIKSSPEGIPIGNLTSQLFANVYLNELDQFVKHTLRVRGYIRYMDDFVLVSDDKAFLHFAQAQIEAFVSDKLRLTLHPKKVQIVPASAGVDYLGYRVFPHYRKLRKSTVKRFIARTKRAARVAGGVGWPYWESMQSWLVYARHARSRGLLRSLAKRADILPFK